MHLAWECPEVQQYWNDIVTRVRIGVGILVEAKPEHCLLGLVPQPKKQKMANRLLQLTLVLAKRRVAICWMSAWARH